MAGRSEQRRASRSAVLRDFLPHPPYSHLLTQPEELKRSPYAPLIATLAEIPAPVVGIYQVVFSAVSLEHNWHQNVETLLDLEFSIRPLGGLSSTSRYAQQAPSGDLRQMSSDLQVKAHNDKPFFATAVRRLETSPLIPFSLILGRQAFFSPPLAYLFWLAACRYT